MPDFKTQISAAQRALNDQLGKAGAYVDPGLSTDGLQAKRQELATAAKATAAPQVEGVQAQASVDARMAAERASGLLPKAGTNADSTARLAAKWQQASMILTAGKPLAQVLATADAETALAIREYGPSWNEAAAYRAPTLGEALNPGPAPDHSALLRSVDSRLAELTGPAAVAALAESRAAAGVEAFVNVYADHLGNVIAGTAQNPIDTGVALAAEDAEQLAVNGAPDDAGADAGAADAGAV